MSIGPDPREAPTGPEPFAEEPACEVCGLQDVPLAEYQVGGTPMLLCELCAKGMRFIVPPPDEEP